MRILITGSFDPIHSGHIAFIREASQYGYLCVGIGNDDSVREYKHEPYWTEDERLYVIQNIKGVRDAWINQGMGAEDFFSEIIEKDIQMLIVNEDQHTEEKEAFCKDFGIEYKILKRKPAPGLPHRTSTEMRTKNKNYDKK